VQAVKEEVAAARADDEPGKVSDNWKGPMLPPAAAEPPRGGRYLSPVEHKKTEQAPPKQVEAVWKALQDDEGLRKMFPGLDASDVRTVGGDLHFVRNESVWQDIVRHGDEPMAKSLLIHELTEIQDIHSQRLDPFNAEDQREGWGNAHPKGLVAEHTYLLDVAKQKGYHFDSILPLVLANPSVSRTGRIGDGVAVQGLIPGMDCTEAQLESAREFYRSIRKAENW